MPMPESLSAITPPPAEAQRLAAVRRHALMGSAAEPAFDALVRHAARLLGAPTAVLGVVDDTHCWAKARCGDAPQQVDRETSLAARCVAQALHGDARPFLIGDLAADAAAAGHPLCQPPANARSLAAVPVADADGAVLGALMVFSPQPAAFDAAAAEALHDLGTLATALLQARQLARQAPAGDGSDPMTGAAPAAAFPQALEVELSQAMRTGEAFAVLRLDIDGFADINTAYGAEAGDRVLREVGRRLRAQLRLGDLLARLGADDFGIVMRRGGEAEARLLAERITAAVRAPLAIDEHGAQVSPGVSVGVASYSDAIASVAELLAQAEASLQQARARKESRWQVFGRFFPSAAALRLVDPRPADAATTG